MLQSASMHTPTEGNPRVKYVISIRMEAPCLQITINCTPGKPNLMEKAFDV